MTYLPQSVTWVLYHECCAVTCVLFCDICKFAVTCVLCRDTGVYPCCGRTAQQGPSLQRPLPQSESGCAYQPHTPLTPPEAPIYNLSSDSVLSDSVLRTQTVGLVHILMKHQSLIVRSPGDVKQEQAEDSRPAEEEQEGHQDSRAHAARPPCRDLWTLHLSFSSWSHAKTWQHASLQPN